MPRKSAVAGAVLLLLLIVSGKKAAGTSELLTKLCVTASQSSKHALSAGVLVALGVGLMSVVSLSNRMSIEPEEALEPALIKKHSTVETFRSDSFTYPGIRVFYRGHPQQDKLPSEPPLPLLVFVHGLGGSLSQFGGLLNGLVNHAPCLAFDLPGCGLSTFSPNDWEAYSFDNLAQLISAIIEKYRDVERGQSIVFVGHSMGCSLAALLASKTSPFTGKLSAYTIGFIAICPRADAPTEKEKSGIKKLLWVPNWIFNLWRLWDRRGGMAGPSVIRFVGEDADKRTRRLQMRYNSQSRTPVLRRVLGGLGRGMPGLDVWEGIDCSVFLIGGEADVVTPPLNVEKIADRLRQKTSHLEKARHSEDEDKTANIEHLRRRLKVSILPSASHGLMYSSSTVRTASGLISDFLAAHIDERLSIGWQLHFLSAEGKWDVKNLAKWQTITPVSRLIGNIFRVMKTLREMDDVHNPRTFTANWGYADGGKEGMVTDVIDISHEAPVYDPRGLEEGGVRYHKFPTVSKYPPTREEVRDFISLVDGILVQGAEQHPPPALKGAIAVHCHYGFNRSGFFVVSYLVEKLGYDLQQALDEFAEMRPNGIKHAHFVDTLFVRYTMGLKRTLTE